METDGFVTFWFEAAQKGDEAAATHLWDWFYPKLVKLAQAQLDKSKRRVYDEEDVALSAFHGVYRDARGGRVPKNCNRDDIWGLLTTQLLRKIIDRRRADAAQKRGGDEVRGDSAFWRAESTSSRAASRDRSLPSSYSMRRTRCSRACPNRCAGWRC